jgi:hypothetical protein
VETTEREKILSYFAWIIGGWNASPGTSMGRLREWDQEFNGNDEKLVRYVLQQHENSVTYKLREENKALKARLYDAARPASGDAGKASAT